MYVVTELDMLC